DPTQALLRLLPNISHPPVVAAAERQLDLRPLGQRDNEYGWKDDLNVDTELIHVFEPHADIAQFPRLHWRVFAHIARLEPQGTVHQPVFVIRRTVGAADNLRPVFVIGTFHV